MAMCSEKESLFAIWLLSNRPMAQATYLMISGRVLLAVEIEKQLMRQGWIYRAIWLGRAGHIVLAMYNPSVAKY